MAVEVPPTVQRQQALAELARALDEAGHGRKGELAAAYCAEHGVTLKTLYRQLAKIGYQSGRKRRRDAGSTRVDEATLTELSAALRLGIRKNGKATMETPNARALLAANGREFGVSNGRLNSLLKARHQGLAAQRQAAPHVSMRSLHPNHVHLVDPSLCLLYYTPSGEQKVIRDDEAYKNKPERIEGLKALKLWRYVLVDHFSNTVLVRYYQAAGESAANLYDFLLWCWARNERRPMHGVPKLLVWDKGSANTSAAVQTALRVLGVDNYAHEAGNPRAKGSVEEANNRVEKLFESRLKYEPVRNVEELNAAADAWVSAYNADQIPEYDARLKRPGMRAPLARFALWQMIRPEHLRILPPLELCRLFLTADPQSRKVRGDWTIQYAHPMGKGTRRYDVRGIEHLYPRAEVQVSPLVYGGDLRILLVVTDPLGQPHEHMLEPIPVSETDGQRLDAPVWGQQFDRAPDSIVEQQGKAADRAAFPELADEDIKKAKDRNAAPFGGLDAHSHLGEVYLPDYMVRRGTELSVPDRTRVEVRPLTHVEALRSLAARLGRPVTAEENARLRADYPDGVPETDLPAIAERLLHPQPARPGLRIVG